MNDFKEKYRIEDRGVYTRAAENKQGAFKQRKCAIEKAKKTKDGENVK